MDSVLNIQVIVSVQEKKAQKEIKHVSPLFSHPRGSPCEKGGTSPKIKQMPMLSGLVLGRELRSLLILLAVFNTFLGQHTETYLMPLKAVPHAMVS